MWNFDMELPAQDRDWFWRNKVYMLWEKEDLHVKCERILFVEGSSFSILVGNRCVPADTGEYLCGDGWSFIEYFVADYDSQCI
jgi:hypothetical protein